MTEKEVNKLIPWVEYTIIGDANKPQPMSDVIQETMEAINDHTNKWQVKKFAARYKPKTLKEQVEFCYKFHQLTINSFKYRVDGKGQQLVQDPACAWRNRKLGVDCKTLTVWADSVAYWYGWKVIITFLIYPKDIGHVYPTFVLPNGQKIIFDATYKELNKSPIAPNLIRKEQRYARY